MKDLPTGKKPEALSDVVIPTTASQQHIEFPSAQTHVLVGLPVTYRKDPDYYNLYIGNHILGGSGWVSKLFDEGNLKKAHNILNYCLKYFILIGIPYVLGSAILGKNLLTILANREVAENAHWVTPIASTGVLFYGLFLIF